MARASYIYLVCPHSRLGLIGVYAAFTVKHEAHTWAWKSKFEIDELELHRMKDNPRTSKGPADRDVIPWDQKQFDFLHDEDLRLALRRNPEGALADAVASGEVQFRLSQDGRPRCDTTTRAQR